MIHSADLPRGIIELIDMNIWLNSRPACPISHETVVKRTYQHAHLS